MSQQESSGQHFTANAEEPGLTRNGHAMAIVPADFDPASAVP
jgi:hypothetical protein